MFGTFYEVEMKGSDGLNSSILGIFSSCDLRLTPDCPVEVNADYFGSIFKTAGASSGKVSGTILGSFEIPPPCSNRCVQKSNDETMSPPTRKFFYSVRVKFHGMQEAVEAHGVPPDFITVQSLTNFSDSSTILTEGSENIVLGGGIFNHNDEIGSNLKENNPYPVGIKSPMSKKRPQRMAPEDLPLADQNAFKSNIMEGCFQESFNDSFNVMYHHEETTKSFHKTLLNGEREIYDSEAGSSFEAREKQNHGRRGRSNSTHRSKSRSSSRAHVYDKPKPSRDAQSNRIPSRTPASQRRLKVAPSSSVEEDSMIDYTDDDDTQYEEEGKEIAELDATSDSEAEQLEDDRDNLQPTPKARSRSNSRSFREIADSLKDDGEVEFQSENDELSHRGYGTPSRARIEESTNESYGTESSRSMAADTNSQSPLPTNKKKFGSTWSPSIHSSGQKIENLETPKKVEITTRDPSPTIKRVPTPIAPLEDSLSPDKDEMPTEGCYLLFDSASGGKLVIQYSKTVVEGAIGFWHPGKGKKLQQFKFKQNQGRSDLMRDIAGKDYRKKYFNGWCQFVKAAKMYNGSVCKWSQHERIELDIYVFFSDSCEVKMLEDGVPFDVTTIDAVSCLPRGNNTFSGVKTGEFGTFINKGDASGASMAVGK